MVRNSIRAPPPNGIGSCGSKPPLLMSKLYAMYLTAKRKEFTHQAPKHKFQGGQATRCYFISSDELKVVNLSIYWYLHHLAA